MAWHAWVLLLYVVVFVGAAMVGRPLINWWRTGINPVRVPRREGLEGLLGFAFKSVVGIAIVAALAYLFAPGAAWALGEIPWLLWWPVQVGGAILLVASAAIVLTAQAQMGESFRIGIDTEHDTALVQRGLYARSRNPIFLGMRLGLLGLFLVMPTAVSLACWLVGDLAIQAQVHLEEGFLMDRHGEAYRRFVAAVPRWL